MVTRKRKNEVIQIFTHKKMKLLYNFLLVSDFQLGIAKGNLFVQHVNVYTLVLN